MKRYLVIALAAASVGFIAVGTASAVDTYNANDPASGIGASRHNLGSMGVHVVTNSTSEICVFCHTPHHTNTTKAPIWNRGGDTASYVAYGSTLGGTPIANGDIGPTTLACLSCHDGVTTLDNLANAPGKGGVTAGGSAQGWDFYEDAEDPMGTSPAIAMPGDRLVIGTNLSNDHPISVAYNGIDSATPKAGLRASTTTIAGIDLTGDLSASAGTYDGGNLTKNLWAVKGYILANATIGDLLRDGKVECSSCHDPHFSNKSFNEIDMTYGMMGEMMSDGMFLRRVGGNTGSGVCRTCHAK